MNYHSTKHVRIPSNILCFSNLLVFKYGMAFCFSSKTNVIGNYFYTDKCSFRYSPARTNSEQFYVCAYHHLSFWLMKIMFFALSVQVCIKVQLYNFTMVLGFSLLAELQVTEVSTGIEMLN